MQKILVITQKLDPQDYVFGFFFGHIIDLASVCDQVHVICLERGSVISLPPNVVVHSLGKDEGLGRRAYTTRLFKLLFELKDYDTVLVHMEPLYIVLCGWWWKLFGKKVVLWYNHIYKDWKLNVASFFANEIISASKEGVPVAHRNIRLTSYENDLTRILTGS